MNDIYSSGEYLEATATSWHSEDSPWKAEQILRIITRNGIHPQRIAEIGCGAGHILGTLSRDAYLSDCHFDGYDISPQAIDLCKDVIGSNCEFHCEDLLSRSTEDGNAFDVLLVIDVIEHVPDYLGFVEQCRLMAEYKIYHIPLDIHVSSVLRSAFMRSRYSIGHLHYFTAESAIATLRDTGHSIIDAFFTSGSTGLFWKHPSARTALANGPRWVVSKLSTRLAARLLGGYSLLVLTR